MIIVDTNVVAEALGHLVDAVRADQQRHCEHDLGLQSILLHKVAADEQIEYLIVATKFDICFQGDRVVGLNERIEEFVEADRLIFGESGSEVVPFHHASQRVATGQLDDPLRAELAEPTAVVIDDRGLPVKYLEDLFLVALKILFNLFSRELRSGRFLSGRVADHGGEVAD